MLNLREYPLWVVRNHGRIDPDRAHRADGLLTIPLPAGTAHLTITRRTPAPELAGDALSLAALGVLLARLVVGRKAASPRAQQRVA